MTPVTSAVNAAAPARAACSQPRTVLAGAPTPAAARRYPAPSAAASSAAPTTSTRSPGRVGIQHCDHSTSLSAPPEHAAPTAGQATGELGLHDPRPNARRQPLRSNRFRRLVASYCTPNRGAVVDLTCQDPVPAHHGVAPHRPGTTC